MSQWVEKDKLKWLQTPSHESIQPRVLVPVVEVCVGVVLGKYFLLWVCGISSHLGSDIITATPVIGDYILIPLRLSLFLVLFLPSNRHSKSNYVRAGWKWNCWWTRLIRSVFARAIELGPWTKQQRLKVGISSLHVKWYNYLIFLFVHASEAGGHAV